MANVNMTPAAGASNYPDLEKPVAFYEKIRRIDMADAKENEQCYDGQFDENRQG